MSQSYGLNSPRAAHRRSHAFHGREGRGRFRPLTLAGEGAFLQAFDRGTGTASRTAHPPGESAANLILTHKFKKCFKISYIRQKL